MPHSSKISPSRALKSVRYEIRGRLSGIAKENDLLIFADEIYDQMIYGDAEFVPMATLCPESLCATFSGLSKVYRACGYRVGWVAFSGALYAFIGVDTRQFPGFDDESFCMELLESAR